MIFTPSSSRSLTMPTSAWPSTQSLLLASMTTLAAITSTYSTFLVEASRAYPHGCMYRHPSYYTYDEREDISWFDATTDDGRSDAGTDAEVGSYPATHFIRANSRSAHGGHYGHRLPYIGGAGNYGPMYTDTSANAADNPLSKDMHGTTSMQNQNNPHSSQTFHNSMQNRPNVKNAHVDFRTLPPKSSPLRKPYDRYRLTRRLGAGKFSDVFEAVDVVWEEERRRRMRQRARHRVVRMKQRRVEAREGRRVASGGGQLERVLGEIEDESFSSYEGDTTEDEREFQDEEENEDGIDPRSLVVLKCLKPISERKIRRELLVLTRCASLPNLARLLGIVLPESMDNVSTQNANSATSASPKGNAPTSGSPSKNKSTSKSANEKQETIDKEKNNKINPQHETQLPALVLEHAGQHSQWLCHGPRPSIHGNNPRYKDHDRQNTKYNSKYNSISNHDDNHLSEHEMKYYLCHLLVALDGLHSAGIMHRDVKPRNCLINHFPQYHRTPFSYGKDEREEDSYASATSTGSASTSSGSASASCDDDTDRIEGFAVPLARQKFRNNNNNLAKDEEGMPSIYSSKFTPQHMPQPLPPPPLMLVDLGLADFYLPGKEYNVRVASRHYKSPELLIGYEYYDYAIDMWSVGCMLAGLLFRREPFFRGKDNEDQLGKIVSVLGTRDFLPYCRKCNVRLSAKARAAIGKYCSSSSSSSSEETTVARDIGQRKPWLSFLSPTCPIPSPEALDLLDKLLVYDHEQRWTAREALGHCFFDDVREDVLREIQERMIWERRLRPSIMQLR